MQDKRPPERRTNAHGSIGRMSHIPEPPSPIGCSSPNKGNANRGRLGKEDAMTEEGQHSRKHECEEYRNKEDSALFEASFKPAGGDLWIKNSVCYGREAALQKALRKLHEGCNDNVFNDT